VASPLGSGWKQERGGGSRRSRPRGVHCWCRSVADGGWFTACFPVRLDVGTLEENWAQGSGLGRILKRIKEQLRELPDNGVGYGLLRYLNEETGAVLSALAQPEIGFNYLGRFTSGGETAWGSRRRVECWEAERIRDAAGAWVGSERIDGGGRRRSAVVGELELGSWRDLGREGAEPG